MGSIDEKRVYSDRTGKTEVFAAAGVGLLRVAVSGDLVGEFGIEHRCDARDVAALDGQVAVATDGDVLVDGEETAFGPAVAVGFDREGRPVAGGDDGRVARFEDGWTDLGRVSEPRAVDAGLVAAGDGVYRVGDSDLQYAGLSDVRDVAGVDSPLAATSEGLYALGNGWMDALAGGFRAVAAAPDGRAHAAGADGVFARRGGEWTRLDLPVEDPVADLAHGPDAVFAMTETGTFLADAGDGWRSRSLGVGGVTRLAVR